MAADRPPLVDLLPALGLGGPSWVPWRVVAKCLDGQGATFTRDEQALYEQCTGRTRVPTERPAEGVVIKGRRAGGSRFGGAMGARAAGFVRYPLAPGERAFVGIAGADREQGRVRLGYTAPPFEADAALRGLVQRPSPWARLADLVSRRTRWGFDLTTGVTVEVRTASYGTIRGRTYALVAADEVAFWQREDGSNPASEVLGAVRPGLATLDGQLVVISTPYAKSGPLWDLHERYYGKDDDRVLVWKAPTRVMNPLIPERVVLDALERDEASARAERLAEFRHDLTSFVSPERLRACVVMGRDADLDTLHDVDHLAFADPATGSGQDSMTLCVAHVEKAEDGRLIAVVDAIRETRPPFDPAAVVHDFAIMCRAYGTDAVYGDKFAAGWTDDAFRREGVQYRPAERTKSQLYLDFLALVNSRAVELPDHPRLLAQATGLQRAVGSGGRERVDHGAHAGAHDDVVNAVAGACVLVHRLASAPRRAPLEVW